MLWEAYSVKGFLPEALDKKPDYFEWMTEYFKCFNMLSPKRVVGFSIGPLTFTEIIKYIEIYRPNDPERFIEMVSLLDKLFMANQAKKEKQQTQSKAK